jgi:hypothetical protein
MQDKAAEKQYLHQEDDRCYYMIVSKGVAVLIVGYPTVIGKEQKITRNVLNKKEHEEQARGAHQDLLANGK